MLAAGVPEDLVSYREELRRQAEADHEAAHQFANKALELRRSAEIIEAEIGGIDRAIAAYRAATTARLVPRHPELAAGED